MPQGKGTYGSKVGRPQKKQNKSEAIKRWKRKEQLKELSKQKPPKSTRQDAIDMSKKLPTKKESEYSTTLGSLGYQGEVDKRDARKRSKKTY